VVVEAHTEGTHIGRPRRKVVDATTARARVLLHGIDLTIIITHNRTVISLPRHARLRLRSAVRLRIVIVLYWIGLYSAVFSMDSGKRNYLTPTSTSLLAREQNHQTPTMRTRKPAQEDTESVKSSASHTSQMCPSQSNTTSDGLPCYPLPIRAVDFHDQSIVFLQWRTLSLPRQARCLPMTGKLRLTTPEYYLSMDISWASLSDSNATFAVACRHCLPS
jgi:hypothetical protein